MQHGSPNHSKPLVTVSWNWLLQGGHPRDAYTGVVNQRTASAGSGSASGQRQHAALWLFMFSAWAATPRTSFGQFGALGGRTAGAQVLVVGTYHMSNPGLDAINIKSDDVLGPKRQREIEEAAAKLAAFRPTKVAIEIPWGRDSNSNALYQRYLAGTHTLDRTEMQQLGFRIARLAGLPRVYGVDYSLRVNTAGVMVQALTSGQPELAGAVQQLTSRLVAEADSLMRHATVGEILGALNSARADSAHGIYMAALRVGTDTSYTGATMTARWYERNLKITANVLRTIESANDRVLVIIGAAHAPILRELLAQVPGVRVAPPADVLR